MKGFLTPVGTPFTLANGPSTPNRPGLHHYFAESHRQVAPTEGLSTQGHFSLQNEALLHDKLRAAVRAEKLVQGAQSTLELLPSEILSLIVEHGYFNSSHAPPDKSFRRLAQAISPHLRNVVLQTPSLWSVMHLSPSNVDEEVDHLPMYLDRSKSHPLHVHLDCFWESDVTDRILGHLTPHSSHLGQLAITTSNDHIFQSLTTLNAPFLTALSLTFYGSQRRIAPPTPIFQDSLPRLTYLRLRNVDFDNIGFSLHNLQTLEIRGHGTWPSFSRLSEVLRGSMALQRLILHVKPEVVLNQVWTDSSSSSTVTAPQRSQRRIPLPELLRLEIFTSEWLTADISQLIQLFECPKLEALVMQEGISSANELPNLVMAYSQSPLADANGTAPERLLLVNRADVYHACEALAYSAASVLTTLELHRAFFPALVHTKEAFANLKCLKQLLILDFSSQEILSGIFDHTDLDTVDWASSIGTVTSASLTQLSIQFMNINTYEYGDGHSERTKEFIRLFTFPRLASVTLKGMTPTQWHQVNDAFRDVDKYPYLTSLKLVGIQSTFPSAHASHGLEPDPTRTFPRLESLCVQAFPSNSIIRPLAYSPSSRATDTWPNLRTLAIAQDPLASKPLLHRVVETRRAIGRPLQKLFLDEGFSRNQESLAWLREHVDELCVVNTAIDEPAST